MDQLYWVCTPGSGSSRGATGVASVRSCQNLPLCPTEPMPASCRMNPPLAKDEPINNSGNILRLTDLGMEKITVWKVGTDEESVLKIKTKTKTWKAGHIETAQETTD